MICVYDSLQPRTCLNASRIDLPVIGSIRRDSEVSVNAIGVSTALRAVGQRPTPRRLLILEAMNATDGHLIADEIYEQVQQTYPAINLSTTHRTLDAQKDLGIVMYTNLGGGRREFALCEHEQHHQLVCPECGSVEAADYGAFATVRIHVFLKHGFLRCAIFGVCRASAGPGNDRSLDDSRTDTSIVSLRVLSSDPQAPRRHDHLSAKGPEVRQQGVEFDIGHLLALHSRIEGVFINRPTFAALPGIFRPFCATSEMNR